MNLSNSSLVLETAPEPHGNGPDLVVNNLSLTFPDKDQGLHVLEDISFSVDPGSMRWYAKLLAKPIWIY